VLVRSTDGPQERRPQAVLTAAFIAAMQDRVVDLDVGVLDLVRHHVEHMVALDLVRDQHLAVVQPHGDVMVRYLVGPRHVRAHVDPAVRVNQPIARHQRCLASGIGDADYGWRTVLLPTLVEVHRRTHRLLAVVDRPAVNMPEQRVEHLSRCLAPRHQIEVAVVGLHVGVAGEPLALLQPPCLLALDLLDDGRSLVGEVLRRHDLVRHHLHALCDQFITQTGQDARAVVLCDPIQKPAAVDVLTVAVIAAKRAVQRLIARFEVAVRVLVMVRADDAAPAFVIDTR